MERLVNNVLFKKIMVVVAHPDDEVLGCGGSISRWVGEGAEVRVLVLSDGLSNERTSCERESKRRAFQNAIDCLGAKVCDILDLPDQKFEIVNFQEIVQKIKKYIVAFSPDVIVTHWAGDLNRDHRIVNEAIHLVCRPLVSNDLKCLMTMYTASSSEFGDHFSRSSFDANLFVSLSKENLSKKFEALNFYAEEVSRMQNLRNKHYLRALATVAGGRVGRELAESFRIEWARV